MATTNSTLTGSKGQATVTQEDAISTSDTNASSSVTGLYTDSNLKQAQEEKVIESKTAKQQAPPPPPPLPSPSHNNLKPLSSQEALVRLRNDIDLEISMMKDAFAKRSFISWLLESISFRSELSKMRWPSVAFMIAQATAHFMVAFVLRVENLATNWVGFQGFILTLLLVFSLAVNFWDTKLRFQELLMKAERIRDLVGSCSRDKYLLKKWRRFNWKSANSKTLFIPKSPCIHQTLTYRDDSCLNLSDFLLVRGDIIHLFPGDRAPGDCVSVTTIASKQQDAFSGEQAEVKFDERIWLNEGEIFHPQTKQQASNGTMSKSTSGITSTTTRTNELNVGGSSELANYSTGAHAKLTRSRRGTDFFMLSTPYLKSLKMSLQRSHKRPVNSIEKECFIISRKYFETYVIPLVFVLSTIVTAVHYGYLDLTDSDKEIKTISIAYLLLRPSLTIMPFLPWMFPCFWMAVNAYGSARLLCCAESQRCQLNKSYKEREIGDWFANDSPTWGGRKVFNQQDPERGAFKSPGGRSSHFDHLLATPTAAGSSDQNRHDDEDLHELQNKIEFSLILKSCLNLIRGKSGHVWRSSSLLQVLGSLTSLCCIDKVGILSWPDPTPEKVFVITKGQEGSGGINTKHHHSTHPPPPPVMQNLEHESDQASYDLISNALHNQSSIKNNESHHHQTVDVSSVNSGLSNVNSQLSTHAAKPLPYYRHPEDDDDTNGEDTDHRHHHQSSADISKHLFGLQAHHGRIEVLDVSQAFNTYRGFVEPVLLQQQATRLQFDDPNWTKFLSNLKPLGLAIMMNNCCERSFGDYFRFCKHITYESTLRCNLKQVVKRRCICDLSRLIGFSRDASKNYKFLHQVGAYKLTDSNNFVNRKDSRLVSSLEQTTRLKLPFPHMVCNIHQDTITGGFQVFSQGTADLILDSCAEFWNGNQLTPLDETIRKKVMDFYHRTSLTSYCSAFSYSPLLNDHNLHDYYIKFPAQSFRLSPLIRRLTNEHLFEDFARTQITNSYIPIHKSEKNARAHYREEDEDERAALRNSADATEHTTNLTSLNYSHQAPPLIRQEEFELDPERIRRTFRRHLSAEDILVDVFSSSQAHRGASMRSNGKKEPYSLSSRSNNKRKLLEETLDELSEQVFVGMVSLQYQACADFVVLVEQLEHACIRFVHFSKENELRSRVFSEKMGLESGWNCHVSLLSDQDSHEPENSGGSNRTNLFRPSSFENESSKLHDTMSSDEIELKSFLPPSRILDILTGFDAYKISNAKLLRGSNRVADHDSREKSRRRSMVSESGTLYSWKSLPSFFMQILAKVSSTNSANKHHHRHHQVYTATAGTTDGMLHGQDVILNGPEECESELEDGVEVASNAGKTESSANENEGFDALAFDMSNRAKLPKGVENIRPHLETVDNIPLQVSLFTDCTPSLTKEMIEIMQDYGEIVCVIGSSSSRLNTPVFLQANASIAIEPLVPQSCTQNKRCKNPQTRKRVSKTDNIDRKLLPTEGDRKRREQQVEQPRVKITNPRDRLGIGPSTSCGHAEELKKPKNKSQPKKKSPPVPKLSSSSFSSSPTDSFHSGLSQTLSKSRSSSSSSSSSSSTSSSSSSSSSQHGSISLVSNNRHRQANNHQESHDGDDDETVDEDGGCGGHDSSDELETYSSSLIRELPEPSSLASKLASLPCSYNYSRKEQVHLYNLIMEARHFTFKMKNTFVCMICFALSISSAQFLASILFLPPMLSSGLTIWLTVVVVPLMSFSLMSTTMDSQVMKIAVGKNLQLKPENITFFVICYLIKFIPSIIVVVLNYGLIIAHSCKLTGFGSSSLGPCWMFTYVRHNGTGSRSSKDDFGDEDLLWSSHLLTAQVCASFLIVLYFVVISAGFVHRSHLMWQRSPTRNRFWVCISLTLIVGQVFYNQLVLQVNLKSSNIPYEFMTSLPLHIWLISFSWPVLVIGINLLVKRAEIKETIRQQRRARFDFNTKLGMNSPF